jgi:hypothetical protein
MSDLDDLIERLQDLAMSIQHFHTVPEDGELILQAAAAIENFKEIHEKYYDLLYQVAVKHPEETRHQTAKRYIRAAESPSNEAQCDAAPESD